MKEITIGGFFGLVITIILVAWLGSDLSAAAVAVIFTLASGAVATIAVMLKFLFKKKDPSQ